MRISRKIYFIPLLLLVAGVGVLHAVTPVDRVFIHETLRRFSYFPIILGAMLYGIRGGLILATCTCLAFIPHLHLFHQMNHEFYLGELTEIILYYLAGVVVGGIASREFTLRRKYQQLSSELEKSYRRLHEQTRMLLKVEEQLRTSQKLSALGQLSASLAHEIKNPLASIKGTAEIFLDEFPPSHPKYEFAQILLKEVARLNTTVEEVLNYSRPGQAAETAAKEALQQVLQRVVTLLDNTLRKKKVRVTTRLTGQSGAFAIDSDRMAQVFINLFLNSCEALAEEGRIEVLAEQTDEELVVRVCDNGPGVPEDGIATLFTPFVTSRAQGTGLGLAISARIMESLDGHIDYRPGQGGGACFILRLPA